MWLQNGLWYLSSNFCVIFEVFMKALPEEYVCVFIFNKFLRKSTNAKYYMPAPKIKYYYNSIAQKK